MNIKARIFYSGCYCSDDQSEVIINTILPFQPRKGDEIGIWVNGDFLIVIADKVSYHLIDDDADTGADEYFLAFDYVEIMSIDPPELRK